LYSDPSHPGVGLEALVYPGNLDIHRIDLQEEIGLDVIMHGEPERNDMVQYFAENLDGFAVTQNGWVQSYESRCTRPSILWGDVSRPKPITVDWSRYAQSLTAKPVKGMLTGPVTILAWSFVRDDQPLGETARQVALALRDEIADLEAARSGMEVIADIRTSGFDHGIGPGVYDIHSPRVPSIAEVTKLLNTALASIPARQLWVNPDCGLKTPRLRRDRRIAPEHSCRHSRRARKARAVRLMRLPPASMCVSRVLARAEGGVQSVRRRASPRRVRLWGNGSRRPCG